MDEGFGLTNPTGSVFISYRRAPARAAGNGEAALVRDALRHAGVPTWRDLDDLEHEPTEDAVVAAINDSSLAGAILLISPEVQTSAIIREVEAFRIFKRHARCDVFWVIPVLIGVDYAEADEVLGSPDGFQELGRWNMHKLDGETLTATDGRAVARRAVEARLRAIRNADGESPFPIGVFARRPPGEALGLTHDFSARFNGREVSEGAYAEFENGLLDGAGRVLATMPQAEVVGRGMAPLPLGALLGAVYSPRAGFRLAWVQPVEGREPQRWSLDTPAAESAATERVTRGDPASEELVLAIGVSANIEQAVAECLSAQGLDPRACMHCAPGTGSYTPGRVLEPEEGVGLVLSAIQKVRELREDLGMRRANLHLFLACPLAMAVLLGQKLNTFSVCHLYEHDPGKRPSYARMHTFQPSSLAYG